MILSFFDRKVKVRYKGINQTRRESCMQVSLSPNANKLIAQMMALGFDDPATLVEVALERMAQQELAESADPAVIGWMRKEVEIGAEQAERGEFSSLSLDEIKAQILEHHQQH
jgi:hypothetical protein